MIKLAMPGENALRAIGAGFIALLVIATLWLVWNASKNLVDFGNVKAALQTTEESAGISKATADTVAEDQAATWAHAQADEGFIRERIIERPVAAGPADPDILRVAREAHARALCSAGRVHGAGCGDDPAGATE